MAAKRGGKTEYGLGASVAIQRLGVTGKVVFVGENDHRLVECGKTVYSTRASCLVPAEAKRCK